MAKKFMEHLQMPIPDIHREYDIVQEDNTHLPYDGTEPEEMDNLKRPAPEVDDSVPRPVAKLARIMGKPIMTSEQHIPLQED